MSQDEVRELSESGWGGLAATPDTPPSLATLAALECWRWCGGWHPERVLLWEALHPVADLAALFRRLNQIREQLAAHQEQQRAPARR